MEFIKNIKSAEIEELELGITQLKKEISRREAIQHNEHLHNAYGME